MIDRLIHWIKAAVVREDYLYCVNRIYGILYRINLCSWEIEKIAALEWDRQGIVTDTYEIDGQIACVPINGIQVAIYDSKSGKVIYDKLETDFLELIDVVIYDHKIWFVPRDLPGKLYYYSLEEEKFMEDHMWEEGINQIGLYGRIKRKCYIEYNQIYIVIGNKIAKYDLENHHMEEVENPLNESCADIVKAGDTYFCIIENDKRKVFYWNVKDGQVFWKEGMDNSEYVKLTKAGKAIFLDAVNKIDILIDGEIKRWENTNVDNLEGANCVNAVKYFDKWILLPWAGTAFIECSSDFTDIKKYEIKMPLEDILKREMLLLEPEPLLEDYMAHIIQTKKILFDNSVKKSNGQVIYEEFKQRQKGACLWRN